MIQFRRIKYSDLSPKQKEIHNFQKVAALLADYGFKGKGLHIAFPAKGTWCLIEHDSSDAANGRLLAGLEKCALRGELDA